MAKEKQARHMTAKGKVWYPHLDKPEEYEGTSTGNLTISMEFSEEETAELQEKLLQAIEEAKAGELGKDPKTGKLRKWRAEPRIGLREMQNGAQVFKFKTKHQYIDKDGKTQTRKVPIFNLQGDRIDDVKMANGTIAVIAYNIVPYWKSADNNGVGIWMDAIQVHDLIEFIPQNGSAAGYGFNVLETDDVPDVPEDTDPF